MPQSRTPRPRLRLAASHLAVLLLAAVLAVAACAPSQAPSGAPAASPAAQPTPQLQPSATPTPARPFNISAIPDQDVAVLNRLYNGMAEYLSKKTGMTVKYVPMVDYAALVTAFERGEIQMSWFGGLTAVQALAVVPDAEVFAQRPRDAEFHSKFIVQASSTATKLEDLKGQSFTFGSESSTSGHLMPRYFLMEAKVDAEKDFKGKPNFSGSHDKTIEFVQSGAYQAGALNEAVWDARVKEGKVDLTKVKVLSTTPAYFDYNWTVRNDVDKNFGAGAKKKITDAVLSMGPEEKAILDLFATDKFVPSKNENYNTIRDVAKTVGIIR